MQTINRKDNSMTLERAVNIHTISGSVQSVSPELASKLLEHNSINRPVTKSHVEGLAREMKAGRWRLNGETIIISRNGVVIDGQHRLLAVTKSGVTIQSFMVTGVDENDIESVGVGRKRSTGDVLGMYGYINTNTLASVARQFALLDAGLPGARLSVSPMEERETIVNNPEIEYATDWLGRGFGVIPRRSVIASAYAYMLVKCRRAGVDNAHVHNFFDKMKTGASLEVSDPIYALRDKLAKVLRPRGANNKEVISLIFRAWNAHRSGRPLQRLNVPQEVPEVEV